MLLLKNAVRNFQESNVNNSLVFNLFFQFDQKYLAKYFDVPVEYFSDNETTKKSTMKEEDDSAENKTS